MQLTSAYVINPSLKPDKPNPIEVDFQDAKLLFYYPEEMEISDKRSHVGISEGVVQFFALFAENKGYMVINSQNYTHVLKEVEPSYWLNLILYHKELFDLTEESKTSTKFTNIADSFYEAIISHCYSLYCLFHHSFARLFKERSREKTNTLLKNFFISYGREYINSSTIDYFPWNFNGFCYCPIDRKNFMRAQLFLNRIKEKFKFVKYTQLLYYSYMVFNDLPSSCAKILYTYLTGVAQRRQKTKPKLFSYDSSMINNLKFKIENELAAEDKVEVISIDSELLPPVFKFWQIEGSEKNGFLLGPSVIVPGKNVYVYIPRIHIEGHSHRLCIFNMGGLVVCLVLEDKEEIMEDLNQLSKLSKHLIRKTNELSRLIAQSIKQVEETPDTYSYYYFNYVNNAIKVSTKLIIDDIRKYDILLNNLHEYTNKDDTTLCVQKTKDYWIVMFKVLEREICVLLNSALSIERVEEEKARFKQAYFASIFVI